MTSKKFVLVLIVLVFSASWTATYLLTSQLDPCSFWQGAVHKSQLTKTQFGGITLFDLPKPERAPNGVMAAEDGSVWFGEWTVPGIGHLYPNGTLVEYSWQFPYPSRQTEVQSKCGERTFIWDIAYWQGRVWAGDTTGNQLVGVDPTTASVRTIRLGENNSFPYTLTAGPDGSLWFTQIFSSKIGKVDPQGRLVEYKLPHDSGSIPSEVVFANSTLGYYVLGRPSSLNGSVYSFSPPNFIPRLVAEGELRDPGSLTLANDGIWIAQHSASSLAFYSFAEGRWTKFPTSTVSYASFTLPYFVRSNGSLTVFNEHYGEKIGVLDIQRQTLTEYSTSQRKITSLSNITNMLTFDLAHGKLWFAQMSENTIGYVDTSYKPEFSVSVRENGTTEMRPGEQVEVTLELRGGSSRPINFQASNSESSTAIPELIKITTNKDRIPGFVGIETIPVSIAADKSISPGRYVVLLTVSDGSIYRSVYLRLLIRGD